MTPEGAAPARIGELLATARAALRQAPFAPSPREAHLLLARALGTSEATLIAFPEREVPAAAAARFTDWLRRRLGGEPVAYLLGEREFWGRRFAVDRRVLVPRPETEHLVEAALALALPPRPHLLDLGTGSGCLAVTLALEVAGARVVAVDASLGALAVARNNRRAHDVERRVALAAADWAGPLEASRFDLLVANPPYLDPAAPPPPADVVDHEPHSALFGGPGGLAAVERLLTSLRGARPGTPLLLEIGDGQGAALARLATAVAWPVERFEADLAGRQRVALLRRAAA